MWIRIPILGDMFKYGSIQRAREEMARARVVLEELRQRGGAELASLPELASPGAGTMVTDFLGGLFGSLANLEVWSDVETARIEVNAVLDQVGELAARLRAAC